MIHPKELILLKMAVMATGADPEMVDYSNEKFAVFMKADDVVEFARAIVGPLVDKCRQLEKIVELSNLPAHTYPADQCAKAAKWLKEMAENDGPGSMAAIVHSEWEACIRKLIINTN